MTIPFDPANPDDVARFKAELRELAPEVFAHGDPLDATWADPYPVIGGTLDTEPPLGAIDKAAILRKPPIDSLMQSGTPGEDALRAAHVEVTDAAEIEQIEDDRRIFQALSTEVDRLRHRVALGDTVTGQRDSRRDAALAHTVRLMGRYADKINALRGTENACPCVVLTSGNVYPCRYHADAWRVPGQS